jgi:hypothetical protein
MAIPIDKGSATRKTTIEERKSLINVSRKFDSLFDSLTELRRAIIQSHLKKGNGAQAAPSEGAISRSGNERADLRGVDGIELEGVGKRMIRKWVETYRLSGVAICDAGRFSASQSSRDFI